MTWACAQLRRFVTCVDGQRVPLNAEQRAEIPGEYPYWGANGVVGTVGDYLFDEPLVLLGEDGAPFSDPLKDVAFSVNGRIWVNNHIHVLRPAPTANARFLTYALNSVDWRKFISGSTREKLTQDDMASALVPAPPLPEQRAIADFLDAETARIDALIERKRRLVDVLTERWLAGITTAVNPAVVGRRAPSLRRAISSALGGSWGEEAGQGEVDARCIRGTDFNTQELVVDPNRAPVRSFRFAEFQGRRLQPGDLIIEKSGGGDSQPVGRVVQWLGREPAVPTNFAARIRPAETTHSRYLTYVFRSAYERGLTRSWIKQTTGIQNLDLRGLLSERWWFPSLDDQERIADQIDSELRRTHNLRRSLARQIELLQEHRQALITVAVTGELKVA